MIDKRIVKAINTGHCFALIGSGPSCEIGYPSWQLLAEETYKQFSQKGLVIDVVSYETYLRNRDYPELFRQAERDIGSRDELLLLLKSLFNLPVKKRGTLYELLTKWPFACYLTTNYDAQVQ